jgi:ankyrin repeat protein
MTNPALVSPTSIKQHRPRFAPIEAIFNRAQFIKAAEAGNVSTLRQMLDNDRGQRSQLNQETINKALIAVASNKRLKDEHAETETVRLLLSEDAALDCKDDEYRCTPLIWAVIYGREKMADLFLDNEALVDGRGGRWDWTPLMWAIYSSQDAMVERLVHRKAILEATDREEGRTPLSWAIKLKRHDAAEVILLKKPEVVEIKDRKKWTPLAIAYMEGDERAAELLLKYGANPNFKFGSGLPLLMSAVMAGNEAFVRLLVDKGDNIDVQCTNKDGEPALSVAVKKGYPAIAEILLDNGAKREVKDKKGRTALLWAVAHTRSDLVELLVRSGASRSAIDGELRTVGDWAEWTKDKRIIELVSTKVEVVHVQVKSSLLFG